MQLENVENCFPLQRQFLGGRTSSHVWKAGEEEGKEEVENDQITDEDGGHEVGDARPARHKDAVPHRLYPLPAQHAEHDHEAKHREQGHYNAYR